MNINENHQPNYETISRIVQAEEVLEYYQAHLEKMFVEDYGKKYQNLIHKRLLNTICITTSTPDFNYQFIKKYHQEQKIYNMSAVEDDYKNFTKLQQELNIKRSIASYNLICHYFGIEPKKYYNLLTDIITLPFYSYSTNSKIKKKDNITITHISNLEKIRAQYLEKCSYLGIKPLLDSSKIDILLQKLSIISKNFRRELLIKSAYLKNLNYSLYSITHTSFSDYDLSNLVDFPAACTIILNRNTNEICNLVYLPLMQIHEEDYNIDNFFLHEFRHAIEASINGIGLDRPINGYHLFNELRTEKHAKEDLNRIETIFGRTKKFSGYYPYTTLIENLTNQSAYFIDDCAINNNISMLEKIFTKENFFILEQLLTSTFSKTKGLMPGIDISIKIDSSNIDNQIFKMNEIAKTNGIKRYQKILQKQNYYE